MHAAIMPDSNALCCTFLSIPLQAITLSHKRYEQAIDQVRASYRRSQAMRDRLKLRPIATATAMGLNASAATASGSNAASATAASGRNAQRLPHYYSYDSTAAGTGKGQQAAGAGQDDAAGGAGNNGGSAPMREHLPPASWGSDTYTLHKFYALSGILLDSVLQGLKEDQVRGWAV